jgi:HK97 family phage portal protein
LITSVVNEEGLPVEVAPGRGDLRRSSSFVNNLQRGLPLVDRHVSYARLYATQPMIASCVGWFLRESRRVPLKVYRREGDEGRKRLQMGEHPLVDAIEEPWERASSLSLVSRLLGPFLVHGNALLEIEQGRSGVLSFMPADWRYALPIMPWRVIVGWELDTDDPTVKRTRDAAKVLHVCEWSPLGPFGISPLEQLGVTIAIEDAAQRHQRSMLANGVRTAAVVEATDDRFFGLEAEERQELMSGLREDVEDTQTGPENSGRPWVLPPGLKITTTGQSAVEADLINQRVVNRIEALGVYGLPPYTMGVVERGSELPEQRQMAYTDGLAPPMILIEQAINSQVARGLLQEPDVYVEADFSGILRGDALKEIEGIRNGIATAVLTPNEGRTIRNMPRSDQPGMDDFYLPRNNLWPLSVPYPDKGMGAEASGEPASAPDVSGTEPTD